MLGYNKSKTINSTVIPLILPAFAGEGWGEKSSLTECVDGMGLMELISYIILGYILCRLLVIIREWSYTHAVSLKWARGRVRE